MVFYVDSNLQINLYRISTFLLFIFPANEGLKKIFAKCRDGKIRVLKVSIENGKLFYKIIINDKF